MKQKMSLWDKFWKDSQGRQGIIQPANFPLIAWAVLTIASKIMPHGSARSIVEFAAFIFLVIWSSLEAVNGVSYFRRALGFIILFLSIYMRVS